MRRWTWIWLSVALCAPEALAAQGDSVSRRHSAALQDVQRATFRRATVHYGKWLTTGAAVAFTVMASKEHRASRRDWKQLLQICRSADSACVLSPDGRYQMYEAEFLYQRSLYYDRRASHRMLGAQASLVVTAALFILDLRPGDGPENIPFSPLKVAVEPTGAALVGLRLTF